MTTRKAILVGSAALCVTPRVAFGQQLVPLTVGDPPSDPGLTPLVGIRTGIYRRYGIDVTIQTMPSGAAISAAVAGGALHVGGSSLMGLINAHVHGLPFQIVAPASIYVSERSAEAIVVRKDAPIRAAADLDGKTVASPALGDLLASATLAWIDANGGDAKSVHQIELNPAATPAALAAGRIDAAAIQEPRLTEMLRSGDVRVLGKPYDVIAKRFLNAALFSTTDFVNDNRDLISRFSRATLEVNAFANEHPDQTAPWLAEFTKVDLDSIQHSTRALFGTSLTVADVQLVVDAAARFKIIDHAFDASELISPLALTSRA